MYNLGLTPKTPKILTQTYYHYKIKLAGGFLINRIDEKHREIEENFKESKKPSY